MIETKYGNFELLKDEREAFDIVKFEEKYLPEYFDKYQYLVGDLADDILRLKGFSSDPKSPVYFHYIPDYIIEGCAYNCKYYILKRIKGNESVEDIAEQEQQEEKTDFKKKKENKNNKPQNDVTASVEEKNEENSNNDQSKKKKKFKRYYKKPGDKNGRTNRNDNPGTNN